MTKKSAWTQLLGWLGLYLSWLIIFQGRTLSFSKTATIQLCYLFFVAANYYFNVYYTIPRFLYEKRYALFGGLLVGVLLASALLRLPVAVFVNTYIFHSPVPGFWTLLYASILNISVWSICLVAARLVFDRFRFQQRMDELERERMKAELEFLNAQFNPHFLFNSINSIYAHIDKHNATARGMLLTFSDMLRYQLYDCNTNAISVEKEMNYIRNYVALQKMRREGSLFVQLSISENVAGVSIAPLLFIGFIENAFKYAGANGMMENYVKIEVDKKKNCLLFRCANSKDLADEKLMEQEDDAAFIAAATRHATSHTGIGIENAKRRLALLYPAKHDLLISENDDLYVVSIKIQLS